MKKGKERKEGEGGRERKEGEGGREWKERGQKEKGVKTSLNPLYIYNLEENTQEKLDEYERKLRILSFSLKVQYLCISAQTPVANPFLCHIH